MGLTTSGRSENVLRGLSAGGAKGGVTILLSGPGVNPTLATYTLQVPHASTAHIQEVHLLIIHVWCRFIDLAFE